MSVVLEIKIEASADLVQALRNGLARPAEMHRVIAADAEQLYQRYVGSLERHKTATQLGAKPTNHLAKAAKRIEGDSDETAAYVRIPRATGLGRAFRDLNITPRAGKKYLTIPAHRSTYGKRAGEVPHDMSFAIVGGRHRALVFTSGPDKGSVAYWLRTSVTVKQDRSLLPSDAATLAVATKSVNAYLTTILKGGRIS
jgi:hypothetical protein